ncbi:hypothetical protein [Mycobacteroides abscessus]
MDFPIGYLWEKTRITWTRRMPLLPKRGENTYRDEAMQDWVFGLRGFLVASYGGVFQRFDNDGADGWGTLEMISWPDNPYLPDGQSVAV